MKKKKKKLINIWWDFRSSWVLLWRCLFARMKDSQRKIKSFCLDSSKSWVFSSSEKITAFIEENTDNWIIVNETERKYNVSPRKFNEFQWKVDESQRKFHTEILAVILFHFRWHHGKILLISSFYPCLLLIKISKIIKGPSKWRSPHYITIECLFGSDNQISSPPYFPFYFCFCIMFIKFHQQKIKFWIYRCEMSLKKDESLFSQVGGKKRRVEQKGMTTRKI